MNSNNVIAGAQRLPLTADDARVRELLEEGVSTLELPVRTVNALEKCGVFSLDDLLKATPASLLKVRSVGKKTLEEIRDALLAAGLRRKERKPFPLDKPIWESFSEITVASTDPADLLSTTSVVDLGSLPVLSHRQALERAVTQLQAIQAQLKDRNPVWRQLNWVIHYAQTREPEPDSTTEPAKTD